MFDIEVKDMKIKIRIDADIDIIEKSEGDKI